MSEVKHTPLPCPFCGTDAEELHETDGHIEPLVPGAGMNVNVMIESEYFGVRCPRCDVGQTNPFLDRKDAIAAWNTRVNSHGDLVEALRPFAALAEFYAGGCEQHPNGCPDDSPVQEVVDLKVGDFRRAYTALSKVLELGEGL